MGHWLDCLPTETLQSIGSYFRLATDLAASARVNRRFHDVFNEKLYDPQQKFRLDRRALTSAVNAGCEAGVSKAIRAGWPVNAVFEELLPYNSKSLVRGTVLYHAVYHGHRSIVRLLIDAGATQPDITNPQGRTSPLMPYIQELRRTDGLQRIYGTRGRYKIESILELAIQRGELEIAEDLLQHGNSSVTAKSIVQAIRAAASQGHDTLFIKLLEHLQNENDSKNPKPENAHKRIPQRVVDWLENNAIVDICDRQGPEKTHAAVVSMMRWILEFAKHHHCRVLQPGSLHAVCGSSFDSVELVELLIHYGANPIEPLLIQEADISWRREDFKAIRLMLEHLKISIPPRGLADDDKAPDRYFAVLELEKSGIDLSVDDCFLIAVEEGDIETMDYLYGKGRYPPFFDMSEYRRFEEHPLWLAVSKGQVLAAKKCLDMGYNPMVLAAWVACETYDTTIIGPISKAASANNVEMLRLLLEHKDASFRDMKKALEFAINENGTVQVVKMLYTHLQALRPPPGLLGSLFAIARLRCHARMMNALEIMGAKYEGDFWWTDEPRYPGRCLA